MLQLILGILLILFVFNLPTILEFLLSWILVLGILVFDGIKAVFSFPIRLLERRRERKLHRAEEKQREAEQEEKRRYEERIVSLLQFSELEQLPEDSTFLQDLGERCSRRNDSRRALACFEKAAGLGNRYCAYRTAQILSEEAETADQWGEVERFAKLAKNTSGAVELVNRAHMNMEREIGRELVDQDRYDEALPHFKEAAELGDGMSAMQSALIIALHCTDLTQALEAEKYLLLAEQNGHSNESACIAVMGVVCRFRGIAAKEQGKYDEAIDQALLSAECGDKKSTGLAAVWIVGYGRSDWDLEQVPTLTAQACEYGVISSEDAEVLCKQAAKKLHEMEETFQAGEKAHDEDDLQGAFEQWVNAAVMGHCLAAKKVTAILLSIAAEDDGLDSWETVVTAGERVCRIERHNPNRDKEFEGLYNMSKIKVVEKKGALAIEQDQPEEALRYFKEGISVGSVLCAIKAAAVLCAYGKTIEELEEAQSLLNQVEEKGDPEHDNALEELSDQVWNRLCSMRANAAKERGDYGKAIEYYKLLADEGDIEAAKMIASIYVSEYATTWDHWEDALHYAKMAEAAGDELGESLVNGIESFRKYSSSELAELRRRAHGFRNE